MEDKDKVRYYLHKTIDAILAILMVALFAMWAAHLAYSFWGYLWK